MKTLLLTLGLGLIMALQAQGAPASEEPDMSGKWYVKAMVTNKGKWAKMFPMRFSVLSSGDVQATFTSMMSSQCQELETVLEKTEVPGEYRAFGGLSRLHVESSSVVDHLLFYSEGQYEGEAFRVAKLMSKNLNINSEALEEFKAFARDRGFPEKDIFVPLNIESCAPGQH
nr:von Ebner gland protein 1-like [Microcebus murinus]